MMDFQKPNWIIKLMSFCSQPERDKYILSLTDEQIAKIIAEEKEHQESYRQEVKAQREELNKAKEIIEKLFGKRSKEFKYVDKFSLHALYPWSVRNTITERKECLLKEAKEKEQKLKKEKEKADLINDAIAFLLERNQKIGTDFLVENAVEVANELAYNEKVKEQIDSGGFVEFSGDDNCEDCEGWDMQSHRCDCGNRRVSWEQGYGANFKDMYVMAVAD